MLKDLSFVCGLLAFSLNTVYAVPVNFSFSGNFIQDDDVQLISFVTEGSSNVTFRTYSYAGGVQANGAIVPSGGFDPIVGLFDAAGILFAQNDDDTEDNGACDGNTDSVTGQCFDVFFTLALTAGSYTLALTQADNFPIGPTLLDGFERDGQGNFRGGFVSPNDGQRTSSWAIDILGAVGPNSVPEPSSLLLLLGGMVSGVAVRRRAFAQRAG